MTREEIKELVAIKCWAVEKTDGDVTELPPKTRWLGRCWTNYTVRWEIRPNYFISGGGTSLLEAYRNFQRAYYKSIAPEPENF